MKRLIASLLLILSSESLFAGPIIVAGMDPEDHGGCPFGAGCEMIQDILIFITDNSTNGGTGVLMVGGNPGPIGGSGIDVQDIVLNDLNPPHNRFHHASTPAEIAALPFPLGSGPGGQFAAIYMPTSDQDIFGGLTELQLIAINNRGVEIVDFANGGGGLTAFSQNIVGGYQWFPLGGLIFTNLGVPGDTGICVTFVGSSVLSPSATLVEPFHTTFDGPPGFFGLDVLARKETGGIIPECDGDALIIGGLTVTIQPCDPICEQRTQGFWRRICSKSHPEEEVGVTPYVDEVVALGDPVFNGFNADDICDLMAVDPPENDMCRKARRQFMALLLNIASERLTTCQELILGGTVQDAIDSIKILIQGGACETAQSIAGGINEGTSLADCQSLLLTPDRRLVPVERDLFTLKSSNPIVGEAVFEIKIREKVEVGSTPLLLGSSSSLSVRLEVFNLAGQKVRTLTEGELSEGTHLVFWNGINDSGIQVPSGIYFARLAVENNFQTRKLLLFR